MLLQIVSPPSGNESHQTEQWFKLIIGILPIGGFLLGYFTHLLQSRRESRNRLRRAKDEFLAVVADQRAKFDAMGRQEAEFFEQSLPAFTRATYATEPFLPKAQFTRLHAILKEYQSHHKREFEGGRARFAASINASMGDGKTHEQTLKEFLDRFNDSIRNA